MVLLFYITSTLFICLLWLYLKWVSVRKYWAKRGVMFIPPHPIFGNLTFLQRINPNIWLKRIHQQYDTPYLGMWMFWKPALIISSPELARQILVKDSKYFRNRHLASGANDEIGSRNLFTVNDPLWTDIRRRLSVIFTASKLRSMQGFVQSKSAELCQRIRKEQNNKKDMRTLFADFTTDVIGTSAFGIENNSTLTGEGPLRVVTKELVKYSLYRGIAWSCIFFLPEVVNFFRFTFFPKPTTDYFRKVFKVIVSQRESNNQKVYNDLLDALLKIRKESAENGKEYSEDTIIAQAAVFLQGGFDTTAVTLTYLFLELAFDQDIQERLYLELIDAEEKQGKDAIIQDLPYLNCVVKETVRKYNVMGWMDRISSEDYKIDEKLTIKAGTPVLINAIGMHYDPKYFPDPEKFNPDRFLPENEDKIQPYSYLPFGDGPRICIGARYARLTIAHVISAIMRQFKVFPTIDTPKPSEALVETRGIFYVPGEEIYLKFIPRS